MKLRVVLIALVLCCSACAATAATYTISLPTLAGVYAYNDPNASRVASLDFGTSFSSIDCVTLVCSGRNQRGEFANGDWIWGSLLGDLSVWEMIPLNPEGGPQPDPGRERFSSRFETVFSLEETFNDSYYFYDACAFDNLLDGKCDIGLSYYLYTDPSQPFSIAPYVELDSVSIVLQGAAVPEPSGIAGMLSGIAGFGFLIRRRVIR
jgi:hypothetical protein